MEVNDTLMHSQLQAVICVGTLPTRRFSGGDTQHFGGHAHRALDLQVLVLGTVHQISAYCSAPQKYSQRLRDGCFTLSSRLDTRPTRGLPSQRLGLVP